MAKACNHPARHHARANQVLSITAHPVSAAAAITQQVGLLSRDALVVAVMQEHGLVNLG
jgi:predicted nucleic acid-binding protein